MRRSVAWSACGCGCGCGSNDSNQEEDYDNIHPDSQHVVPGSHGGGHKADFSRTAHVGGKETDSSQIAHRQKDVAARLSIDVQNSKFLLQTGGNDLKEIIKVDVDIVSSKLIFNSRDLFNENRKQNAALSVRKGSS